MRRDDYSGFWLFIIGIGLGFLMAAAMVRVTDGYREKGVQEGIQMGYQKAMTEYNERLENKAWIHFDQAFARDVEEGTGEVRHATR